MSRPSVRVRPPASERPGPRFTRPGGPSACRGRGYTVRLSLPQRLPKPKPPLGIPAISTMTAPVIAARIRYTSAATSTVSRIPIIFLLLRYAPSGGAPHRYPPKLVEKRFRNSIPDEHWGFRAARGVSGRADRRPRRRQPADLRSLRPGWPPGLQQHFAGAQ